ncbi:methyl-accepting chemotaxis protein [Nitrogeniibacter aestuarii]|uniref:methyl-accepting chemotaxis protein n=1 Tax=Nitrogeniibacter aestuarii TaxID=2815343 RepID=UPI001D118457|nr:methyl-accepting chemotaxis protein [Nitrogeniibacter aestuarii]
MGHTGIRLTIGQKMIVVCIVALGGMGMMLAQLASERIKEVERLDRQTTGAAYSSALLDIIVPAQRFRALRSGVSFGDDDAEEATVVARDKVVAALEHARAMSSEHATLAAVSPSLDELAEQWPAVSEPPGAFGGGSTPAQQNAWLDSVMQHWFSAAQLTDLGNTTDTETRALADASIRIIPPLIEYTSRMRDLGYSMAENFSDDPDKLAQLGGAMELSSAQIKSLTEIEHLLESSAPARAERLAPVFAALYEGFAETTERIRGRVIEGNSNMVGAGEIGESANSTLHQAVVLATELAKELQLVLDAHRATARTDLVLNVGLAVGAIVLTLLVMWAIGRSLRRSIQRISESGRLMASGDLTVRIDDHNNDEMGQIANAFNALSSSLRELIDQLQRGATRVSQATENMASMSARVGESSRRQSASAREVANAAEHLSTGNAEVADHAADVQVQSSNSLSETRRGQEAVNAVGNQMNAVREAIEQISEATSAFVESAGNITKMTGHVREIAEQTNLLALNAAIEAARAGEQGRGFAVVADEVRKLAEKSAQAANEIDQVTRTLTERSESAKSVTANGISAIRTTQERMSDVSEALSVAGHAVGATAEGMDAITDAVNRQKNTGDEIVGAVDRIAREVEQNSTAIQALADNASQLRDLATELAGTTSRFRI